MLSSPNLGYRFLLTRAWTAFRGQPVVAIAAFLAVAAPNAIINAGNTEEVTLPQMLFFLIFSGPLQISLLRINLRLIREEQVSLADTLHGFQHWLTSSVVFVSFNFMAALGLVLFIVPGVFILVALFPLLYLVADRAPSPLQAYKTSWALTAGLRWELFGVFGIFILLVLAGILTFGIGAFFTLPLGFLLMAAAYEEISLADSAR